MCGWRVLAEQRSTHRYQVMSRPSSSAPEPVISVSSPLAPLLPSLDCPLVRLCVRVQSASRALVFGTNHAAVQEERVATVQSLSGTGSLRVAFEFLR